MSLLPSNKIEIVRETRQFNRKQQSQLDLSNRKDFLYHLTHHVHNQKHSDGRINMGYDENGKVLANSVSPYADNFIQNVEPGIKPVIEALINKRYLTYSSCEGHSKFARRYVGVAFWSKKSRDDFMNYFKHMNKFGVITRPLDRVCNEIVHIDEQSRVNHRRIGEKENNVICDDGRIVGDIQDEIDSFNISFHRQYKEYYFCELIILDEAIQPNYFVGFKQHLILRFKWLVKWIFWDYLTKKVSQLINDPKFPKYNM